MTTAHPPEKCAACEDYLMHTMTRDEFRRWYSEKYNRPECEKCGALVGSYIHWKQCELAN